MTVTGVDLIWDGIPDVLQRLQDGFGASARYGAPVQYGVPVHMWRGCLLYHGDVVPQDANAEGSALLKLQQLTLDMDTRLVTFNVPARHVAIHAETFSVPTRHVAVFSLTCGSNLHTTTL